MPFVVTLPGGTTEHELAEYVRVLRTRGIDVAHARRGAGPGAAGRWLHAWQDRAEAQRVADELKASTANPGWAVDELHSLVCPNCHIGLEERQLVATTWAVEACPNCRAAVRRQEVSPDRDALIREDVAAIEDWLGRLARAAGARGEPFGVAPDAGPGSYRWEVGLAESADPPLRWSCTVEYGADAPGVFEVRLTGTQGGPVVRQNRGTLGLVCAEHGVQPHLSERRSWVAWEGERVEVRWGARQLLATAALPEGLFEAVVSRLDRALAEAVRRLGLGGLAGRPLCWAAPGPPSLAPQRSLGGGAEGE
jgi:hypothetical protein